jgi:hypothetical protein
MENTKEQRKMKVTKIIETKTDLKGGKKWYTKQKHQKKENGLEK